MCACAHTHTHTDIRACTHMHTRQITKNLRRQCFKNTHIIYNVVFWVMTPCNLVDGYQCFKETHCLHLQHRKWRQLHGVITQKTTDSLYINRCVERHSVVQTTSRNITWPTLDTVHTSVRSALASLSAARSSKCTRGWVSWIFAADYPKW